MRTLLYCLGCVYRQVTSYELITVAAAAKRNATRNTLDPSSPHLGPMRSTDVTVRKDRKRLVLQISLKYVVVVATISNSECEFPTDE